MPDPWGGDNMSDEYAGAMKSSRPAKQPEPDIPVGWKRNDNEVPVPAFLLFEPKQHIVAPTRPNVAVGTDGDAVDAVCGQLEDFVHHLFNNSCRALGVDLHDGRSEGTFRVAQDVAKALESLVRADWKQQDEEKATRSKAHDLKVSQYREMQRELNALKAKLKVLGKELKIEKEILA